MTNQARYNNGNNMGHAKPNPILDSRQYVVEFEDGTEAELTANVIAQIIYAQCDPDSNQYLMLDYIADFRRSTTALCYSEQNFVIKNGLTYRCRSTAVWKLCCQWKDGSMPLRKLAGFKDSHPIKTAKYPISRHLQGEPAFNWWVPHVIKKRELIILLVKRRSVRYFKKTDKFGVRLLKSVDEAYKIDAQNGNFSVLTPLLRI